MCQRHKDCRLIARLVITEANPPKNTAVREAQQNDALAPICLHARAAHRRKFAIQPTKGRPGHAPAVIPTGGECRVFRRIHPPSIVALKLGQTHRLRAMQPNDRMRGVLYRRLRSEKVRCNSAGIKSTNNESDRRPHWMVAKEDESEAR